MKRLVRKIGKNPPMSDLETWHFRTRRVLRSAQDNEEKNGLELLILMSREERMRFQEAMNRISFWIRAIDGEPEAQC